MRKNPDAIDPSNWITDQAGLDRPGNVAIQLAMAYDYRTNVPLYPYGKNYSESTNHQH